MVDVAAEGAKVYDKFQFERLGYFCVDQDTTNNKVQFWTCEVLTLL